MTPEHPQDGYCRSGPACKMHDGVNPYPTPRALCDGCLSAAEPDVRGLVFDYLDLAQLQEPSMSQAINQRVSGGATEAPMPLAGHVDELQAEIVHALSVWEYELRTACRLSDPGTYAPLWRTTVYDHIRLQYDTPVTTKARGGHLVQRAVSVVAPRLDRLAALPDTLVCPTGVEDEPVHMAGWEAVHQLQMLHRRARAALGRTTRRFWIPGECWACAAHPLRGVDGPLYRSEPRHHEDPMEVHCSPCGATRPYPDYETYMSTLLWPALGVAA
ncbi:MAG: hypothetical protein ABW022_08460 [Actinoplanes sp.]